ncbi:MAG: alanine--tRNA ligase, partial [Actinobacteria bacterium]|nr:alanine--tRNA ligase [Actinomycetota bacterium]
QVRVVSVGDWARELCGGTHVSRSGQLGVVKLLSESSIGAGVRRVEALVGADAYSFLAREHLLLSSLTELIKGARPEELPERISDLLQKFKEIEKELAMIKTAAAISDSKKLIDTALKIGKIKLILTRMSDGVSGDDLRSISLNLRNQVPGSVVVLASVQDEKVVLVAAVDQLAQSSGIKAGALVKSGSEILGGGGGGKDDFAQGGGVEAMKIDSAFNAIKELIEATATGK